MLPPPSQVEIGLFWVTGIVIALFSGGVAIYAFPLSSLGLTLQAQQPRVAGRAEGMRGMRQWREEK
jgi:hypothetical protein